MVLVSLVVMVSSAAPSQQLSWSVRSPDGNTQLTQTGLPDDACELECAISGKPAWSFAGCLGRVSDFNFVSNDCSTAVTLLEYPLKKATPATTPVALAIVGGTTTRTFFLGQLGATSRGDGKRMRWLAGVVGEPGVKPHLNADETGIEFMTVDGRLRTVRFSNLDDFVPQSPRVREAQPQSTGGLYQFTAADGSTQFVMGLDQVPKAFRKSARPVASEVDVVQGAPRRRSSPAPFMNANSELESVESHRARIEAVRAAEAQRPLPWRPQTSPCGVFGLMSEANCRAAGLPITNPPPLPPPPKKAP